MNAFLIAGNWKMNGSGVSSHSLASQIISDIEKTPSLTDTCDFLCCPPHIYLLNIVGLADNSPLLVGGQDCSTETEGAFTGDISAPMLADCGAQYCIVGHSERRTIHGETSQQIAKKGECLKESGIKAIICVGETITERKAGKALDVIKEQLKTSIPSGFNAQDFIVAYEPVWAIGSGEAASPEDVAEMHRDIRNILKEMVDKGDTIRILYGGSVKPDNAGELAGIENVGGFLIGGASLKADSFLGIAKAAHDVLS
ncbi:MAG: triose-phosphate isomerase [Micavibrio sp.]|nr:triose-phosphate isomerase [Micavibrio sp.]|tara:strand:- start:360100 stop:360867 length:768 start_codon:yes stop_codon:yes gene_type:complete